jgi:hypothetical protein
VAKVGCIGHAVVKVVGDKECGNLMGVCYSLVEVAGGRGWVGVEVLLPMIRRPVLSLLLLAEDANNILQFC